MDANCKFETQRKHYGKIVKDNKRTFVVKLWNGDIVTVKKQRVFTHAQKPQNKKTRTRKEIRRLVISNIIRKIRIAFNKITGA